MDENSQLQRMQALLEKVKTIPVIDSPEPTIFSIGSKGYYENPTTDMLAFFCDNNASHKLGSLVLEALIECLPAQYQDLDCNLVSIPEREVVTKSSKRIDLLLESQEWSVILENKIYHEQNNPFQAYEDFVNLDYPSRFKDKQAIFVVLSPEGNVPSEFSHWIGISYPTLTKKIKEKLAEHFISQPLNKWIVLLREFILHLESMMKKTTTSPENFEFIFDNLVSIKELNELKDKVVSDFQSELQQSLSTKLNKSVKARLNHWNGFPALRFALEDWNNQSESDVVLCINGSDGSRFQIYYFAHIMESSQSVLADEILHSPDCDESWEESKGKYKGYKFTLDNKDIEQVKAVLAQKLQQLDTFEQKVRGTN